MVNVEVAGALPKVKMVNIMPEDKLLFDGSNVEEFIDAYEFAAGLIGTSEYDKARQIILFIPHKSDARLILKTLNGFESKDWPRLKAAILSYWGRSKVPHVQEVNNSALIASVRDINKVMPTMEAEPLPEEVPASPRDSVTVEEVAQMFKQCEERLLKKISSGALHPWYPPIDQISYQAAPVAQPYLCRSIRKSPTVETIRSEVQSSNSSSLPCPVKFIKAVDSVLRKIANLMVPGFSASRLVPTSSASADGGKKASRSFSNAVSKVKLSDPSRGAKSLRDEVKLSPNLPLSSVPDSKPSSCLHQTVERLIPSSTSLQEEVKLSPNSSPSLTSDSESIGQLHPTTEPL
ncbi:hypothetical protein PTTG_10295, partial [Puccinia triticina 1-1 BBBD Race 1]|uniref:Uncharacterized protein n=1 Tax=Puccinia triticina (isolate 1-1 / race 1 (BBBD)) TaxID=630390 RepID=A0A0C4FAQ2_PUCT1